MTNIFNCIYTFVSKLPEVDEFQKIANKFIIMVEELDKEVEKQKIKAIGARNILQTMEKQKENNQQQLQVFLNRTLLYIYFFFTLSYNTFKFLNNPRSKKLLDLIWLGKNHSNYCYAFHINNLLNFQALITEKLMELERLKIQLNSLQKADMEQNEVINQLHC